MDTLRKRTNIFLRWLFVHVLNSEFSLAINVDMKQRYTVHKKMIFSIKDFVKKCDQVRKKLRIWSHLLKKSWMENFIFCAVT